MNKSEMSNDKTEKECSSNTLLTGILFARSEESIFQDASNQISKLICNKDNSDLSGELVDGKIIEQALLKEQLQKQVQCGELTPFQVLEKQHKRLQEDNMKCLVANKSSQILDLEKYLQQQAELGKRRKQHLQKKHKTSNPENNYPLPAKRSKSTSFTQSSSKQSRSNSKQKHSQCSSGNSECVRHNSNNNLCNAGNNMYNDTLSSINMKKEPLENSPQHIKESGAQSQISLDLITNDDNSGSEYVPSDEHSDLDEGNEWGPSKKRHASKRPHCSHTKRILDDGDEKIYKQRIENSNYSQRKEEFHNINNLFKVPKSIWKKLYKYQRVSVQWLWELHSRGLGGLLGDEMGLGKTVQVIAFLAGLDCSELLSDGGRFRGLGPTLIVCPATLMEQWVKHFHDWWPILRVAVLHQSGTYNGQVRSLLHSLMESNGVLVTSYSSVLIHKDLLIHFQWHYIILDEGHKIRNSEAKVTKAVKLFSTPHRLLLTGSPMQNSLKELWSLFDFILPGKLGTLDAFLEHVANPITRGGYANASALQEATALQIATVLKDAITPYMLRRTKTDVKHHLSLPQKNEQILFCSLTDEQTKLYKSYLRSGDVSYILHDKTETGGRYKARLLIALSALRKICNHPDLFLYTSQLDSDEDIDESELTEESLTKFGYWKRSGKMVVVRSLLKIWKKQGHRVLLFTQGRQMMHILESLLQQEDYTYLRLDGTTPMSQRQQTINKFNENTAYFVFLLTTRVGGLGVNLTGADRVIIYDPDWNPATDAQARERAWRIGQNKRVTIYRLITAGTIEEKMYHRQVFKLLLSSKVLDDPRQRRLFKTSDLTELFNLNECLNGESSESERLFHDSKLIPMVKSSISETKFSQSKIEEMKKLATDLSKKLTNVNNNSAVRHKNEKKSSEGKANITSTQNQNAIQDRISTNEINACNYKREPEKIPPQLNEITISESKNCNKKKKKDKNEQSAIFEGERISCLIGRRFGSDTSNDEQTSTTTEDDNYVLKKLFAKSTVSSAFQHESVLSNGRNANDNVDTTPMQRLARETAEQNMNLLRESRKWCWKPTWGNDLTSKGI